MNTVQARTGLPMQAIEPQRMSTFLTRHEMFELTGAKTRRRQLEVLRLNGVPHIINAAGWPVVCRSAIEGSAPRYARSEPAKWTPRVLQKAG